MATWRKNLCFSITRRLVSFIAALLLLLPRAVFAGAAEVVRSVEMLKKSTVSTDNSGSHSMDFTIEQNGDLVLRCLNKSFTMARDSLKIAPALLETVQGWQMQVEPDESGISVRVAYRF